MNKAKEKAMSFIEEKRISIRLRFWENVLPILEESIDIALQTQAEEIFRELEIYQRTGMTTDKYFELTPEQFKKLRLRFIKQERS